MNTVTLDAASVLSCGINLNGDKIHDDKTNAFGPFLFALMRNPTPTSRTNGVVISTITFGGSEALQTACRAFICTEFIEILSWPVNRPVYLLLILIKRRHNRKYLITGPRSAPIPQDLIRIRVVEKSNAVYYNTVYVWTSGHLITARSRPVGHSLSYQQCLNALGLVNLTSFGLWT